MRPWQPVTGLLNVFGCVATICQIFLLRGFTQNSVAHHSMHGTNVNNVKLCAGKPPLPASMPCHLSQEKILICVNVSHIPSRNVSPPVSPYRLAGAACSRAFSSSMVSWGGLVSSEHLPWRYLNPDNPGQANVRCSDDRVCVWGALTQGGTAR